MKKLLAALACAATLTASLLPITANADVVTKPKYTVLALDTSSSMETTTVYDGEKITKIEAEKAAAKEFCKSALENGKNQVAVITFDSSSSVVYNFTDDIKALDTAIDDIYAYGATNFEEAFKLAKSLLDELDSSKVDKNIVLCSDGLPVRGESLLSYKYTSDDYAGWYLANSTLKYDNEEIKPNTTVYTLGFYDNLSEKEAVFAPMFMKDLASGGMIIAKNGDELKTGFNKFAKDINKVATPDTPDNPNGGNTNGNGEVKSPKTGNTFGAALVLIGMACGISMLVIYSKKRVD